MKLDYIEINNAGTTTVFATLPADQYGNPAGTDAVKAATAALKKAFAGAKVVVTDQPISTLTLVNAVAPAKQVL